MTAVKAYVQTHGREFQGLTNAFMTISGTYLLTQHLLEFYISSFTTIFQDSTDSTSYKMANMAGSPRYHVSVYAVLTHLMALSSLLVPTQATSITSTRPTGSHPVLAAGSANEWYSVCCSPEATTAASLTSDGPRCCNQPTSSDSLNVVHVSEWSTCTTIPVSAESCGASHNEQVWNDFHLRICREADSSHSLFPPESISGKVRSEDASPIETEETADVFHLRNTALNANSGTGAAVEKRSECDIAPENGNCSSAAPPSLRCPSLVTLLSMLVLVTTFFTGTTAADAAQGTSCPANAKAVRTIAVRDNKKDTYVVCCPKQAADMAAISFGDGMVTCCFGPLCVYPSVDVKRCDGGVDDMMSVGYEVGGRSVCLVTDKAKRSLVESQNSGSAAYDICPTGSKNIVADYPDAKGNYSACCPDGYTEKAKITNRGTGHVYCCDSVDCTGSALDAVCAEGAAPVKIKGDKVTVCRTDEVAKRAEGSARTDLEFEKRRGGSHTSGAARGLSFSSPSILLMATILALAFVVKPAAAGERLDILCPANYYRVMATADGMNGKTYTTGLDSEEMYVACCPSPLDAPFQRNLALTDRPRKRNMCCAPGGDCSKTPSKAVSVSECSYKRATEKVDLFGDGVELCKVDVSKIGPSSEKSPTGMDLQKRKGGRGGGGGGSRGGGGCPGCTSTAYHDHSIPSPLLLIALALVALVSSLTKVGAASDEAAKKTRKPLRLRSRNSATAAPTQPTLTIAPARSS